MRCCWPAGCRRIQSLFNALGDEAQGKTIGLGGDGRYFNKEAVRGAAASLCRVCCCVGAASRHTQSACWWHRTGGSRPDVKVARHQMYSECRAGRSGLRCCPACSPGTQPLSPFCAASLLQVQIILKLAAGNGVKKVGDGPWQLQPAIAERPAGRSGNCGIVRQLLAFVRQLST